MGDGEERRPKAKNLDGLFKFCVENTKPDDAGTTASTSQPHMSDDNKVWLSQVLSGLALSDPVKDMMQNLKVAAEPAETDDDLERQESALENLQEFCENIDLAKDFHKIGGYEVLVRLLRSSHAGTRWRAADVFASVVQNNPHCQQAAIHVLPLLVTLADTDPAVDVRVKALYAVSCLVRGDSDAETQFAQNDGFSVLIRAMQSDTEKLQVKAAFFLCSLLTSRPVFKDEVCEMGVVEQLALLLRRRPHRPAHEHVAAALATLADGHARATAECRRPQLQLRALLAERAAELRGRPESKEELEWYKRLETICFSEQKSSANVSVDR